MHFANEIQMAEPSKKTDAEVLVALPSYSSFKTAAGFKVEALIDK
jgi:hypothetical protein